MFVNGIGRAGVTTHPGPVVDAVTTTPMFVGVVVVDDDDDAASGLVVDVATVVVVLDVDVAVGVVDG